MSINNKRPTLGYITPYIWGGVSLNYFRGVHEISIKNDANLICYIGQKLRDPVNYNYQANTIYNRMSKELIDGLVVWASHIGEDLPQDQKNNIEGFFLDVPKTSIAGQIGDNPYVMSDDDVSIQMHLKHLYAIHNYTKFGFVRAQAGHQMAISRYEAFVETMRELKLEVNEKNVTPYLGFSYEAGDLAYDYFYEQHGDKMVDALDAIIVSSDAIAFTLLKRFEKEGIRVPEDIAVVGINNKADSRLSVPPLTTVDLKFKELGIRAADLMYSLLAGERVDIYNTVSPSYIIRQSCGCFKVSEMTRQEGGNGESQYQNDLNKLNSYRPNLIRIFNDTLIQKNEVIRNQQCEKLAESLIRSLLNEDDMSFVQVFSEYLETTMTVEEESGGWQTTISGFEHFLLSNLKSDRLRSRLYELINFVRDEIEKAYDYQLAYVMIKNDNFLYTISNANANLRISYNIDEMMDSFSEVLLRMEIPGCYIVKYNSSTNLDKGEVIFAYENSKRVEPIKDTFDTSDLLPEVYTNKKKRFTWFTQAIFFREVHIGYIIFEAGPIDKSIYQVLTTEISGAIYRSQIFNSLLEAEDERSKLMAVLEKENVSLEKRIEERTKDIKKVNEELEAAIIEARKANNAKSQFLANMSHEIRTPLNCIIGFADMISEESTNPDVLRYTQMTLEESEKLLLLINQLLDLSKIEAGKIQLSIEPMDLHELMASLTSTYAMVAHSNKIEFLLDLDDAVPRYFKADSLRLRQVLVNIIGNAIKFTEHGSVQVGVYLEDNNVIRFKVEDTGIGIDEERLEAIFKAFEQESSSTSKTYGGTGLGMAISKQLIEMMGGQIEVHSKKGEGTMFEFTCPYEPLNDVELKAFHKKEQKDHQNDLIEVTEYPNHTILIVEDYPPNRLLAKSFLEALNTVILEASNGQEAIDIVEGNDVDMILMDVQMPIMDGMEATKVLRSNHSLNAIPIIGMTANAFASDIKRYKQLGMNDVITKPFRKKQLQKMVVKWLTPGVDYAIVKRRIERTVEKQAISNDMKLIFNHAQLMEDLDHNQEIFQSLLDSFYAFIDEHMILINDAFEEKNYETLASIAHKFKGAALNMTAVSIGEMALALEGCSKKQDNVCIKETIEAMQDACKSFIDYSKSLER